MPCLGLMLDAYDDPVGRLTDEPVQVVAADPVWPWRFEQERALLEKAIGQWVVGGVHHVGSTSVPGLDAKPIIDILVGVSDLEASRACFAPLAGLQYQYAPYRPQEMHWFCKPHPSRRTHHLHLIPIDSQRYQDELLFRDWLQTHHVVGAEYAALKHTLAARFTNDRDAYTEGKAAFIEGVLREACSSR